MIIQEKEVVTLIQYASKILDYEDISIVHMDIDIDKYITLQGVVKYYNVDAKIKVVAKINNLPNKILVRTKGIIKYGFINLDLQKLLKEHVPDNPYMRISEEGIILPTTYIKAIHYGDKKIELEFT